MNMTIPLFNEPVAAGFPSPAEDYQEEGLDFNKYLVKHPAATFCVRVSGPSMTGAGIFPGDILVVDRSISARPGHIVVAAVNGDFTVKYLQKEGSAFFLKAAHPDYPPLAMAGEEELFIWGVVTFSLRHTLSPRGGG